MGTKDLADRLEAHLQKAHEGDLPAEAEAETLRPLLEAAEHGRLLRAYRLPEGRRRRAKARLQAAWAAQESAKGAARRWHRWLAFPAVQGHLRGAVVAATLVLLLLASLTFTAVASSDPGSIVYPARAALERVPALFQSQPQSRASVELKAADRRLTDLDDHLRRTGQPARAAITALQKGDAAAAAAASSADEATQRAVADRIAAHAAELARLAELTAEPELRTALLSAAMEIEQLASALERPTPAPRVVAPATVVTAPSVVTTQTPFPSAEMHRAQSTASPTTVRTLEPTTASVLSPSPTATAERTGPLPTLTPDRRTPIVPGLRATAGVLTPPATMPQHRPTTTFTPEPRCTPAPGARATALATVIMPTPTPEPAATTAPAGPGPGRRATALAQTATPAPSATPTPTAGEASPVPTGTPVPGRRATALAQRGTPMPAAEEPTTTPTSEVTP
ncbi:MAG: hypothetical protein ACUVS6_08420 [Anaerolineae bacterium]